MSEAEKAEEFETADLCPALKDPKNLAKFNKAYTERQEADYMCYMVLREIHCNEELRAVAERMFRDDPEEGDAWLENAEEWLKKREDANDRFLEALCGR